MFSNVFLNAKMLNEEFASIHICCINAKEDTTYTLHFLNCSVT